jgi:general stress protein 26
MLDHPDNPVAALDQLIGAMDTAMLTTMDAQGRLRSRPMLVQRTDFDGSLWFLAVRTSHMADDIREHPNVNVSLTSPVESLYVSISGKASLVEDHEGVMAMWKPSYKTWFPKGPEDSQLALLKVEVEDAEYWESPSALAQRVINFSTEHRSGKPCFTTGQDDG